MKNLQPCSINLVQIPFVLNDSHEQLYQTTFLQVNTEMYQIMCPYLYILQVSHFIHKMFWLLSHCLIDEVKNLTDNRKSVSDNITDNIDVEELTQWFF